MIVKEKHITMKATRIFTILALLMVFAVSCNKQDESCNHEYVDLDLPSGTLWATCNVGADTPEDYGDYFSWGETQTKDYYDWSTYQYCNGNFDQLTKYCDNSTYGYNDYTDNLIMLLPEDDAATANWGSGWHTPSKEEWEELFHYTTRGWTTQNGVVGMLFSSSNGSSLFLPAAGCRSDWSTFSVGISGLYWSCSLRTSTNQRDPYFAWYFNLNYDSGCYFSNYRYHRCYGISIRPVRSTE